MVSQAFADTKNTIDEGYIQMGHDNEGSFIKFNNLPLSSPLKYFKAGGDFTTGNGYVSDISEEGKKEPDIIIPDGTKEIMREAFSYNTIMERLIIADSVKEIGDLVMNGWKFSDSSGSIGSPIKYVKLSRNLEIVPYGCFSNNPNLEKIDMFEGLREVGSEFCGASSLSGDIVLPTTLVKTGFKFLSGLSSSTQKITSIKTNIQCTNSSFLANHTNVKITFNYYRALDGLFDISSDAFNGLGDNARIYVKSQQIRSKIIESCITNNSAANKLKESQVVLLQQ